jgi:Mn2+/Fe2+ NRAMP family transporter
MVGFRRFFILLTLIGTAIIASNIDNDAGGITVYSIARANYGCNMLWTPIPIVFLFIIISGNVVTDRIVNRKGLADLIWENDGARTALFFC